MHHERIGSFDLFNRSNWQGRGRDLLEAVFNRSIES